MIKRPQSIVIISHVPHFQWDNSTHAYGPYTKEIELWCDLFEKVYIACPCQQTQPDKLCTTFTHNNISLLPQPFTGGNTVSAKLIQLIVLPWLIFSLCRAIIKADAVHVRNPANLGLLGCLLAPLFKKPMVSKYAGQWNGFVGEPWANQLQRKVLASSWWKSPVLVYGDWPNQPKHIVSFFTSMMTNDDMNYAQTIAKKKTIHSPLRLLFSGRLETVKRIDSVLEGLKIAKANGLEFTFKLVGDGTQRQSLEALTKKYGLHSQVSFVGGVGYEESLTHYEWADSLILASRHSEGWPKAIAEAMAYGLVCIGVDHGQVKAMLTERGIVLQDGSANEIAEALCHIQNNKHLYADIQQAAAQWSSNFTREGFRRSLAKELSVAWQTNIEDI